MKKEILLIGGGGHCKSVIDVVEQENIYTIAGIIDKKELIGQELFEYKVIDCDDNLELLFEQYKYAIVTVGQIKSSAIREKLFKKLKDIGYTLPIITSPLAYVSKHSYLGEGTVIMHHALVNANVTIGKNCIINTKSLIEHDSIVEDHCHVSTAAVINGGVKIKQGTFFGSNATSKELIEIEEKSFIKAGSIVK